MRSTTSCVASGSIVIVKRADVAEAILKRGLPEYMDSQVENYLFSRVRPGGFLMAVVNGDFFDACLRADMQNALSMKGWAHFYLYDLPLVARGSDEAIAAWLSGVTKDF